MVELLLKQKIVAPGFVHEMDVYSSEPWNLGVDFEFGQGKNEGFFLTPRHPTSRSGNGRRAKRSAGDGYWHGESGETQILAGACNANDKHVVVGYKTTLAFKKRDGTKWPNNEWIMHEYSLCCDKGFQPKALCRIYKKAAKGGGPRPAPPSMSIDTTVADDEPMMSQQEMMAELFEQDH